MIARLSTAQEAGRSAANPMELPNVLITPETSPTMRVSGVVQTATGVHAILNDNGQSQEVQPGDAVDGGTVVSIQSDGLTLRATDGSLVHVPLGGAPSQGAPGGYPGGPGGYPGGPGGYPGGPGGYPGGPGDEGPPSAMPTG
jgi:hypothetical protein